MGEYTTPVGIELGAPIEMRVDHKCIACGYSGTAQQRYDHEQSCLTAIQDQVKALIRMEKQQMRTQRPTS